MKTLGLPTSNRGQKLALVGLERFDRIYQALSGLFREPHARRFASVAPRYDRFGGTTAAKRDYRSATSLGFDRHDAEILLARKQQGPATAELIPYHVVRLPAQ